jgi:hypothetical protein
MSEVKYQNRYKNRKVMQSIKYHKYEYEILLKRETLKNNCERSKNAIAYNTDVKMHNLKRTVGE